MNIEIYELYANKEDAKCYENILASVMQIDGEQTIVAWEGDISSIVIHQSLENFMKISVTGDRFLVHHTSRITVRRHVTLDKHGNEMFDDSSIMD